VVLHGNMPRVGRRRRKSRGLYAVVPGVCWRIRKDRVLRSAARGETAGTCAAAETDSEGRPPGTWSGATVAPRPVQGNQRATYS
jgi:hypothetical protein